MGVYGNNCCKWTVNMSTLSHRTLATILLHQMYPAVIAWGQRSNCSICSWVWRSLWSLDQSLISPHSWALIPWSVLDQSPQLGFDPLISPWSVLDQSPQGLWSLLSLTSNQSQTRVRARSQYVTNWSHALYLRSFLLASHAAPLWLEVRALFVCWIWVPLMLHGFLFFTFFMPVNLPNPFCGHVLQSTGTMGSTHNRLRV